MGFAYGIAGFYFGMLTHYYQGHNPRLYNRQKQAMYYQVSNFGDYSTQAHFILI